MFFKLSFELQFEQFGLFLHILNKSKSLFAHGLCTVIEVEVDFDFTEDLCLFFL